MKRTLKKLCMAAMLTSCLYTGTAFADVATTSQLTGNNSIKVIFEYEEGQGSTKTPLEGATYSIWQVASMNNEPDYPSATFNMLGNFRNSGVDFTSGKGSEAENASKLYSVAGTPLVTKVTDENGTAEFTGLENGMYLLAETAKDGNAAKYTSVEPFIIMAPDFENGRWNGTVTVYPKSTVTKTGTTYHSHTPHDTPETTAPTQPDKPGTVLVNKPDKPDKPGTTIVKIPPTIKRLVQTSDPSHIALYLFLTVAAAGIIIGWAVAYSRKKKE